jgi:hypothetical protein
MEEFEGGLVPTAFESLGADIEATEEAAEAIARKMGANDIDAVKALINQAMAARDAEIQALRAELETVRQARPDGTLFDEQASVGGYPWMYWRKPEGWANGVESHWITVGPGGATPKGNRDVGAYTTYLRKGFTPITKYGYVEPPVQPNAVHMFLPMLRKGGAVEFPASQVIAYQWHIRPPIPGLKFPQYEAIKSNVLSFVCEACGHQLFFMPEQKAQAGESYRAHLMSGHGYPFREAAEAVRAAGLSLRHYRASKPIETEAATVV